MSAGWPGEEITAAPAPAAASGGPRPILIVPDPKGDAEQSRANADQAMQRQRFDWEKQKHDQEQAQIVGISPDLMHVTGDEFLGKLPPSSAAQVKALAEGRMAFPAGKAAASPYWQQRLAEVSQYDPEFDAINYNARAGTRRDFTSGKSSANIKALNTAIGHLGQLGDQISGTASHGGFPGATTLNKAENALYRSSGASGITKFEQTAGALAGELTQVYRQSGGAEADIQRYMAELDSSASLEQKQAAVANMTGLLKSRLDALNDQYNKGMGVASGGLDVLDKHSKEVLAKYLPGFKPDGDHRDGQTVNYSQETPGGLTGSVTDTTGPPDGGGTPPGGAPQGGGSPGWSAIGAGVGDIVEGGINNTVGMVANPINTVIGRAAGYENYTADLGKSVRDILGLPEGDPRISAIVQAAAGGLALSGLAGAVGKAVGGAAGSALSTYGAAPVQDMLAGGGAAASGELAKQAGAGPGLQAVATLAGGGIGAGIGSRMNRIPAMRDSTLDAGADNVMGAADRLNGRFGTAIRPMPADVGGPGVRNLTGAAAKMPLGASPIVKGAQAVSAEAEKARNAVATLAGGAGTPEAAGEAALNGARNYIKRSKTKVDALYARARKAGGDQPVDLASARQTLDHNIAELAQTPGGAPGLSELQSLRTELDQPFPVEGVKRMRSTLRDRFLGDGLRGSDIERRVGQVVDAADIDIEDSLNAAGKPDAARAYAEASAAHKERLGVIDNILAPIIGSKRDNPRSPEEIMRAIDSAAKTKGAKLGAFLQSLPPDDAGTVRATVISRLGHATNGTQNAAGDAFSLPQFLTHWNAMSGPAKSQLFGGELSSALSDIAKVAQGTKEAQRYANFSNTGSAVGLVGTGAVGAATFSHPVLSIAAIGGQYGLGRLLASPSFARWLAKTPTAAGPLRSHIASLSRFAAADSVIAADATGLLRALQEQFSASPLRAAAEDRRRSGNGDGTTKGAAAR